VNMKRREKVIREANAKWAGKVHPGTRFSTDFETGCVAIEEPDQFGSFGALDSEGVECGFSLTMVKEIES